MTNSSENSEVRRVAICGAGAAGLTLAIQLAEAGWRTVVFDGRSEAELRSEGVFLTLAPNGANGLRAVGCFDAVLAAGIETTGIEIRNGRGVRLGLIDQSDHATVFGAPSITVRRGALAGVLLDRARVVGVDVRLRARLLDVEARDEAVELFLGNGDALLGADVVVGADGLRSKLRSLVFPEYPAPRFTGLVGTGGFAEADIPDTGGLMRMTFGDKAFFGYLKPAGQPAFWFNSYSADEDEAGPVADPACFARELQAMHATDPVPNGDILARVRTLDQRYPIYDMPELPSWRRGRVVLIGDAAHAVGPHAGQGASMAIEDALVLAACLCTDEDPETAFARYEGLRRGRVAAVVRQTARNGSGKHAAGGLRLFIRDLMLWLLVPVGARAGRRFLAFRADLNPLARP